MHSVIHGHVGRSGDTGKDIRDSVHSVVKRSKIVLGEIVQSEMLCETIEKELKKVLSRFL